MNQNKVEFIDLENRSWQVRVQLSVFTNLMNTTFFVFFLLCKNLNFYVVVCDA